MQEIRVDNEVLFIDGLKSLNDEEWEEQGIKDIISEETLKNALSPVIKVGNILKKEVQKISPNKTELTLQLKLGLSGGKLAFAIVNVETEAHLSIKFIWDKESE